MPCMGLAIQATRNTMILVSSFLFTVVCTTVPAKKLDQRLLHLGAKRIIEKGLEDDKHPAGYEGALDPWLQSLWRSLNQTNPSLLPRISDAIHPNLKILGDAKDDVIYYSAPQDANFSDSKRLIERARSMSPALKFHNDGEPQYMLQMVTNQRLTKEDSERDVRHLELEDPGSAISYQVGDTLEILPSQNPSAVDAFIKRCNLDPDCYITICKSVLLSCGFSFLYVSMFVFFSATEATLVSQHFGGPH
uniref:Sulfite reductase [NADPH] flavoprotein alpha-component-like FAD-binding domain-containing protein n=1 Tax=Arundo donax TaxID=35708 RepID=A0A0A9CWW8_ARUDO